MRVVVLNTVAANTGDAAILQALTDGLQNIFGPSLEITVFDANPRLISSHFPEYAFRERLFGIATRKTGKCWIDRILRSVNLWRFLKGVSEYRRCNWSSILTDLERSSVAAIQNADLVISTGGTYLVPQYSLLPPLLDYQTVLQLGKPLILFTQSLGPFQGKQADALSKALQSTLLFLVRDKPSKEALVSSLSVPSHLISQRADSVFALQARHQGHSLQRQARTPQRVAISVRAWKHFKGRTEVEGMEVYRASMRALVTKLVGKGMAVTFISTCQGLPGYADDSVEAMRVVEGLAPETRCAVSINRDYHRPDQLQSALKEFDLIVATRMHAAILASTVDVPILPIAYEFKTTSLFEAWGLGQYLSDINTITPQQIVRTVDDFLANLAGIRETQNRESRKAAMDALRAFEDIRNAYEALPGCSRKAQAMDTLNEIAK